jgi:hypothetical protein
LREALFMLAGSRLDGRTHALPMCPVDRMESLKDWKAGPRAGDTAQPPREAGNEEQTRAGGLQHQVGMLRPPGHIMLRSGNAAALRRIFGWQQFST